MKYNFTGSAKEDFLSVSQSDIYSPERGYGFSPRKDTEPYEFSVYTGKNSTYSLYVTIDGGSEGRTVSLLTQSRRFMMNNERVPAGEHTYEFSVCVCDIHMSGSAYTVWDRIRVMLMADEWCITAIETEEKEMPVIYIAGDSTVTDQPAEYPYHPESSFCGWGQMISGLLKPGIAVSNHAQSGSTTAEFLSCNWNVVKERMKPGDMLIVEFGHNDQKIEELDAFGGYRKNLIYFIEETKKRGAYPVINSPINRIIFNPDGTLADLLGEYGEACRVTAEEYGVPMADMLKKTTEFFEAVGSIHAWDYFRCLGDSKDYTHTNDIGGALIAKFFAQEAVEKNIMPIAGFIKTGMTATPVPECEKPEICDSSESLAHMAGIGLVHIPKNGVLPDIDNDIRDLQK